MRGHLDQLARDKDLRERLGTAARRRVEEHLTWEAKARQTLAVYEWVTHHRREKPEFAVQ